uniref:Uncharacterized protein n=1 Tax=Bartonella rochalimae ATCC BAA-1498 TaxID=685782 RepID=E6YLZ1_9HYPH|nr:hypothetical protein BARRO_50242 [Bartonella rochalimae ATCC BAA-1498]
MNMNYIIIWIFNVYNSNKKDLFLIIILDNYKYILKNNY